MALLSLTLKDSANRWANIIMGIVLAGLGIPDISILLIQGKLALSLISVSIEVVAVLIVWLAWKWPKKEVVAKPKK